jgi:long-chain acyl-CoA synthetase
VARAAPIRELCAALIWAAPRTTVVRPGAARNRPRLRLLVSGGLRLERETEERLEALGWTVLSGYGLAETASLFTGNRPGARRPGSVGRPLADGKVRIAEPNEEGIGEIELRGSSIIRGYLDNPEANQAGFTADGWYRTGDLGFVDRDGFLFVTGRAKEVLVLGGGKKVTPEDLEPIYGAAPEIAEVAVLEDKGALVALVRPDRAKLHDRGATNLRDGIRVILAEKARDLPSWQRLSGFALTEQPLPRTRLGKYQRFLLPALYAEALAGATRRAAHTLTPEDMTLLRDPTAEAVWTLSVLGWRPGANVFQPAQPAVLPGHSRLSRRCKPSRRGALSRPASAEGWWCAGLVSRGLALSGWHAAAFPAGRRSVAAA